MSRRRRSRSRVDANTLEDHAPGPLFLPLPGNTASLAQRRVAVEERPPLESLQQPSVAFGKNDETPSEGKMHPPTAHATRSEKQAAEGFAFHDPLL